MTSAPTYVLDLSVAIADLIKTSLYNIYHITNTGFASRYEIASFIAKAAGYQENPIKKISVEELGLKAKRPKFSGLNNNMWKLEGFKELRNWQDAVIEFLKSK